VFDLGTTSVKASLFDHDLTLKGYSRQEYSLLTESNRVELDPETYWEKTKQSFELACSGAGINASDVVAVTVTTQGETIIPIDEAGKPLYNAIVWMDTRAEQEAEFISLKCTRREFYRKTGISSCTGMFPIAKLMWVRNNMPIIYETSYKFLLLEDYILLRLSGRFVTEKSLLSTTGYFDIQNDCYSSELLDVAGIDPEKLPEAVECGTPIGQLSKMASEELGLSQKTLVITGAMDQVTGALGAGNIEPGIVTETTGSGMTVATTVYSPDFENTEYLPFYRHAAKGVFLVAPVCSAAGIVIKWFKDEFCAEETRLAGKNGRSVYELLDEIAETAPLNHGLVLLPYFSGVIQPDSNSKARGVFFGVGLDSKKSHFLRAILESIAFQLRENVELIERVSGIAIQNIRSLGGGAKSKVLKQIKSDVVGVPISSMLQPECTSLGGAVLAARAAGWYDSIEEPARQRNEVKERIIPEREFQSVYDEKYTAYRELYSRLKTMF
jgi:xylulokinase